MQVGMVGAGRMGSNMVHRLLQAGHECVVYDVRPHACDALIAKGALGAASMHALIERLRKPRVVWLMLPAALVDAEIEVLAGVLEPGDIVVDGGNSHFKDDVRRARDLAPRGVRYVDVGTSGGVAGRTRGYCLMIGGDDDAVSRLTPLFVALAPGIDAAPRTGGGPVAANAEEGYLHCGPNGAGHFAKMVHNGIEYGLMAAYAEGMNILRHGNSHLAARGVDGDRAARAREPGSGRHEFDLAGIAELWRRGSVIDSWLLDLTARALSCDPQLSTFSGRVDDSGEGRWALEAAIDEAVPAPVLAAALFARFDSRGRDDYANRVLSAMRQAFGGHEEVDASPPNA